jgi:hypothetical protein
MLSDPLVHIGFHKTGSTWLQHVLFTPDSDCFFPLAPDRSVDQRKYLGKRFVRDDDRYLLSSFELNTAAIQQAVEAVLEKNDPGDRVPVISYERLSGNPHAGSFDARIIAERIKAAFPDARIFIVIREQKDAILSTYFQYLKIGGIDKVRDYLTRSYDGRRPGFSPAAFSYIDLVDYYCGLFSPEHVLVLPYEMLRDAPGDFLRRLGDFTGKDLAAYAGKASIAYNKRRKDFLVPRFPFLNLFRRRSSVNSYSPLYLPGSKAVFDAVDSLIGFSNRKHVSKVKRQIEEITGDRYAEGNRRLSERTGIDLSVYGYY